MILFGDCPALLEDSNVLEFFLDGLENDLDDVSAGFDARTLFILVLLTVHLLIDKVNTAIFVSLVENFRTVHHLLKVIDLKSEILNVVQRSIFVVSNGLHHQLSAGEKIAFQVELNIDGDEPEIDDIRVKLDGLG